MEELGERIKIDEMSKFLPALTDEDVKEIETEIIQLA